MSADDLPALRTVAVPVGVLEALRPAAETRGITVNALCRNLLAEIAEADLVTAVLDDAAPEAAA